MDKINITAIHDDAVYVGVSHALYVVSVETAARQDKVTRHPLIGVRMNFIPYPPPRTPSGRLAIRDNGSCLVQKSFSRMSGPNEALILTDNAYSR
jgi:hypothetical protein